jgi:hypothetical protein
VDKKNKEMKMLLKIQEVELYSKPTKKGKSYFFVEKFS